MSSDKWSENWFQSSFGSNSFQNNAKKRTINDRNGTDFGSVNSDSNPDSVNHHLNQSLTDVFVPNHSSELAFSKQKHKQLNEWFNKQFITEESDSPFLLITGPAGSGKTTAVNVFSKEYKVEIIEFKTHNSYYETCFDDNLVEINKNSFMTDNQSDDFKKFLWDSNYYRKSLSLESNDGDIGSSHKTINTNRLRKLILIEEFPNIFDKRPEGLHKELKRLYKRFSNRCVPIVFIISEKTNGDSDEYKLLPKWLRIELSIKEIKFSKLSPTALHKAISQICNNQLPKEEIQKIVDCSSGDLRSAINTIHLKHMYHLDVNNDEINRKKKRLKTLIETDFDSGGRDLSFTLFHTIGKVLYAKRISSENDTNKAINENSFEMPEHLRHNERKPLIENAEDMAEKLVVSSDVFNGWLHENYLDFVDNISNAEQCIQWLSDSDYMLSGQDISNKSICDSYKSSLAMRGLMFNLKKPSSWSSDPNLNNSEMSTNKNQSVSIEKTGYKFKSFVPPKTKAINETVYSLKRQIRQSLPQLTQFSGINSLAIDFMPYISQMPKQLSQINQKLTPSLDKFLHYNKNESFNENDLCKSFKQTFFTQKSNQTKDFTYSKTSLSGPQCYDNTKTFKSNPGSDDSDNESDYKIECDSD